MIALLDPSHYRRTPWKNGGGTTIDIAESGDVWRFGRTPITTAGPFSDYTGFDRLQVLVAGRGLVLETPDGEIDVRTPFKPVRFRGETPIMSRLEAGPVEVVNLIAARAAVRIDLEIVLPEQRLALAPGIHFAYAADGPAIVAADGNLHRLAADHCLRIEGAAPTMLACEGGRLIAASII